MGRVRRVAAVESANGVDAPFAGRHVALLGQALVDVFTSNQSVASVAGDALAESLDALRVGRAVGRAWHFR